MADTAADLIASLPPEALEGLVDSIVPPARQKVRQYGTKLPLKQGIRQVGMHTSAVASPAIFASTPSLLPLRQSTSSATRRPPATAARRHL